MKDRVVEIARARASILFKLRNNLRSRVARRSAESLAKRTGLNSAEYWDVRFEKNWESRGGRLQSTLLAASFAAQRIIFEAPIDSVLDFGCGLGDALPVLDSMFPQATLCYTDVSAVALAQVARRFGSFATPWASPQTADLVYCSNVVEHVDDIEGFLKILKAASDRFIVVQAPFDERHGDRTPLSLERPLDEHIRTIGADFLSGDDGEFVWRATRGRIRVAWPTGEQIFFVGTRKSALFKG
jgi:SAM-dependent methyltransferase